jgi:hypothetical protein
MANTTIKRIEVLEAFKKLQSSQSVLCAAICHADADLPAWNEHVDGHKTLSASDLLKTRQAIVHHISKLWYQVDDRLRYPGLIACSPNTITLLQALNNRKAQFERLMVKLRKDIRAPGAKLAQLLRVTDGKRDEDINQLLKDVGMKGINLSLCYRRFQQLPDTIQSVSWTWSLRSRSIKTIGVQEAMGIARKKFAGMEVLDSIVARLNLLDPGDPLAIVKPVQPILKANIVFQDIAGRTVRKQITAHSPLFYLDNGKNLPRKKWPGLPDEDHMPARLRREQRFLEDTPYIKALNLYRYLD